MKRGDLFPLLLLVLPLGGFGLSLSASLQAQDAKDRPKAETADEAPKTDLWTESGQCGKCHVEASWRKLKAPEDEEFNHASTGFPLRDAHKETACSECHSRGLAALSQACTTCHRDPHAGTHTKRCTLCHNERRWKLPRNFFNHGRTRFPLLGRHAALACADCHRNSRTVPLRSTPTECIICHARDFRQAGRRTAFDHEALGFSPNCARCHNNVLPPRTFQGASVR
jgi:hypothetical protein